MAHIVEMIIENVSIHYAEITQMGDPHPRFTPSRVSVSGRGWLDNGAEVSINIPATQIECNRILSLLDEICERTLT